MASCLPSPKGDFPPRGSRFLPNVLRRHRLLPQPDGFEGLSVTHVDLDRHDQASTHSVHTAAGLHRRRTAKPPTHMSGAQRDDRITSVDEFIDFEVELVVDLPSTSECVLEFRVPAICPRQPSRGIDDVDNLGVDQLQGKSAGLIRALDKPPHNLHLLLRHPRTPAALWELSGRHPPSPCRSACPAAHAVGRAASAAYPPAQGPSRRTRFGLRAGPPGSVRRRRDRCASRGAARACPRGCRRTPCALPASSATTGA
jgi:hypothetical protein